MNSNVTMVPLTGISEGMMPGVQSVWMVPTDAVSRAVVLANAVATFPLSNSELLRSAERHKPPQSWYDEDHGGLY
jgi:hypothetical protein